MSRTTSRAWATRVTVILALAAAYAAPGFAQQNTRASVDGLYSQLPWRFIGPEGNRVSAVVGIPGDPRVYYAGAASGGIFKTSDGGVNWQPIFDDQPVASIGALAVAPSDPNVVWAGTGEGKIRSNISVGQGIYKSTDAGRTWALMGLEQTGRIPRLVIDPQNPDIVLACALGHAYGPQPERGVFRTTNGGKTWERVLFVDENTGCSDIAINPKNPRILFAGMWQLEIHTWGRDSGGPGSGLFMSRDGGVTWTRLTGHGLPTGPVGKVAVAIAPSNPNRVYAMIETGNGVPWRGQQTERGVVWRSDDGGEQWRMITADRNAVERPHYYSRMAVAPDNENDVYFITGRFARSIDGGETVVPAIRWADGPGADHHDMWIDPTNPNRMIVGHDLGLAISIARGGPTWHRICLPIAQMYHVTVDNQIPYYDYRNRQDGPGYRGPSNSRRYASAEVSIANGGSGGDPRITRAYWHTLNNGESGWATPDPVDANIVWSTGSGSGHVGGIVMRYEESRRQFRNVEVWPDQAGGPPADLKYRFNWTMPFTMSPHDRNKVYVGSQFVHQTTDGGQSWQEISPDLTLNDKSRQQSSGGLTPENNGVDYAGVVFSIDESPIEKGLIWAGTNDGLVHLTRDGGKTWTNLTKNLPNLPAWGTVSSIDASRYDAGAAYLTVDFHQVNNRDPFIYKTIDYGKTWKAITNGIPHTVLSYVHCIREDPVRRGLLYLGTENGMYVSFDDGENWQPLQMNLPHAPVYGIVVQEHFNDLVIGTYGRGFWILDDITPLQQSTSQVLASDAHLFAPRQAYRFRQITNDSVIREDEPSAGNDPPYGADINYYLKSLPNGPVTVTILDQKGEVVRTLPGTSVVGLNRIYWDLRYAPTKDVRLRTSGGGSQGRISILAPPGSYTVKLSTGGREFTRLLTVVKDPHSAGTEADIQAQMKTLFELRRDTNSVVDVVNQIELIRVQIDALARVIDDAAIKTAGIGLNEKLISLEQNLLGVGGTGPAAVVGATPRLISKLGYLANELASADFQPTNQQLEVQKLLEEQLASYQSQFDALRTRDLAAFNELLRQRSVPHIITTAAAATGQRRDERD
ncbi:MAG: sialidase [Acidobacteria bacterium]|nr:sialidase [Acidobacteriota bacterium]